MIDYIKKNKANLIIFGFYIVISFIIIIFHESWRDEAQSWLIARDLNFIDIIKQMTYEGHPALWYLILIPFAKIGLPYFTIKIISWIITTIGVWLIIKKSPFNTITKILIIFSMPMLYLYPAIARSYCLIPLAITLISIFYNKRHEKPIQYILSILLLASTHVIMYGLVAILLILFFAEELILNKKTNSKEQKIKIWISLAIIIVGLLFITIPIFISVKSNTDANVNLENKMSIIQVLNKINGSVNSIIDDSFNIDCSNYMYIVYFIIAIFLIYECMNYKKNFLILISSLLFQIMVYSFIYICSIQRAGTILLIIMFIMWIQKEDKKEAKKENKFEKFITISALAIFAMSVLVGTQIIYTELTSDFSSAQKTATYINNQMEKNSIFICNSMPAASAIIPYCNESKFWSPQIQKYFTFVTWNEEYKTQYNADDLKNILQTNFPNNKKIYLLYTYDWNEEKIKEFEKNGFLKKEFESEKSYKENYCIYSINF